MNILCINKQTIIIFHKILFYFKIYKKIENDIKKIENYEYK